MSIQNPYLHTAMTLYDTHSHTHIYIYSFYLIYNNIVVVRVLDYRSKGPGFDSWALKKK
jgi:hypothetical protein